MEKFSARSGALSTAAVRKPTLRQALESRQLPEKISITKQDRLPLVWMTGLSNSVLDPPSRICGSSLTTSIVEPSDSPSNAEDELVWLEACKSVQVPLSSLTNGFDLMSRRTAASILPNLSRKLFHHDILLHHVLPSSISCKHENQTCTAHSL